jgi:FMNH2-dependent dimethyl sulfone monooxygenase
MRFGIWTPRGGRTDEDGIDDTYGHSVDIIQRAERAGFDITLIAQRLLGPDLEAMVLASALAAATSRIELLVAIHPGVFTPQLMAKMGATLDRISRGRFAVNLVNGWWQEEIEFFSNKAGWLDQNELRYRRMEEYLKVVQGLWSNESFSFHGEFFSFDAGRVPTRPIRFPPIYTASRSDSGKDVIARLCHHWFVHYEAGFRNFERNFEGITADVADMKRRAESYGRKVRFAISANAICADTQREAEAQAEAIEDARSTDRKLGGTAITALGAGLVGTPDRIVERLNRYEQTGVECVLFRFPDMLHGVERFERDIIPRFRKQVAAAQVPDALAVVK